MKKYNHPTSFSGSKLLTIDRSGSVLDLLIKPFSYSCFGYLPADHGLSVMLAFNALPLEPSIGCYLLGNGRRAYNPMLMRFQSPDALSPFEAGGLNAYGYCEGDPMNWQDKSGQARSFIEKIMSFVGNDHVEHVEFVQPTPPTPPNTPEPSRADRTPGHAASRKEVKFSEKASIAAYGLIDAPDVEKKYQHTAKAKFELEEAESEYKANPTNKNKIRLGKAVDKQRSATVQFKISRKTTPPFYTPPVTYQENIRTE
ncbi:RHS repeat-associated core domain-containing protein [Pseudomonas sp. B21-023]|uniref:RHS repeat-associated core domain-containing protein n=1 Tax=unclassified Pseudomonas TaxID=196821 RepID=UPI001118BA34|nr:MULTISPECIES: RHS repeat-associated core domain-containing protein [unclassified Pseudomonas]UVL18724.1 RHS repeat-associated core domain-containing protein [Pseudomonas sp. B21-044]UVM16138.1 RHS repeat-associated core domain-containing protein [Pseudomonas sp. B21-023]